VNTGETLQPRRPQQMSEHAETCLLALSAEGLGRKISLEGRESIECSERSRSHSSPKPGRRETSTSRCKDFRSLGDFGSLTPQGSTMRNNVRLQNLRDFTVQIRRPSDHAIVGTGIAVTMDGQIVTCAHVFEAALGVRPRQADGAEVGVYFPQARGGEEKGRWATVVACFPQHDDDVNEALDYAVDGGYRIDEADIRVALAWAHLAAGDRQAARAEAERAQRMSADMGYHWGQVDAAEVLEAVRQRRSSGGSAG
jgi:hypothetical protein